MKHTSHDKENDTKETAHVIAVAGNPNVGKSTLFNALTGMNQHTGNWSGKTVAVAQGRCETARHRYTLVDIPGTYSLMPHSAEEEVARSFLCFGKPFAAIVVCDATCLQRSIALALQVMELCPNTMICVNLMDEAKRKGISIDLKLLEKRLGVPVIGTTARDKRTLKAVTDLLDKMTDGELELYPHGVTYPAAVEAAAAVTERAVRKRLGRDIPPRWLALRLLEKDKALSRELSRRYGIDPEADEELFSAAEHGRELLAENGVGTDKLKDLLGGGMIRSAEDICRDAVKQKRSAAGDLDRRIDRILTGRRTAYPIMTALLLVIFWLTVSGANYPSQWLSAALFALGDLLMDVMTSLGAADWLCGILIDGAYRVLAWVVSVMLPPMAIFFPLFTLLEDSGYLPRIAYNLDRPFKKCSACGKQALTMAMGFGCNAAGVVGCRIIDSRREQLIAMLTNSFVPCNGRFPTLIAIISIFFAWGVGGFLGSVWSAVLLTAVILLGIGMTFLMSRLLSKTLLRGQPSAFTLELPPYRPPQVGRVLLRSVLDRTIFVLGRAAAVAAPAGALIWLLANVTVGDATLLAHITGFLDPFARLIGLDGVILAAFILGLPANEIVVPLIIMAYTAGSSITELQLTEMRDLFIQNGWTWVTAVCMLIFSLMHWPCSTTILTVKKESGSVKWAVISALLPAAAGIIFCFLFSQIAGAFVG